MRNRNDAGELQPAGYNQGAAVMEQHVKQVIDGAVVTGALSSPLWLQILNTGVGLFMLLGGAVLLGLRLAIAWREWRHGHPGGKERE